MDFTEILLFVIEIVFKVYLKLASVVLWAILPLTRKLVKERMESLGLIINGPDKKDPQVKNDEVYIRSALEGETGMYESYMDGHWTSEDLVSTFGTVMLTRKTTSILHPLTWTLKAFNLQSKDRVWDVAKEHYDIGNDIYESMLDENMQYTCGYWKDALDLDSAQVAKMELIAQKLKLEKGMRVLDIGCGFGTLAHYLATKHGVHVTGCSISIEQTKYGQKLCKGLPVEFLICDYRELDEKQGNFDRVVSVGMMEHVGPHNYSNFFKVVHRCLKDDGLFLLHTIGNNHKVMPCANIWLHRYIFPNGCVPYYVEIAKATEEMFIIEDWHNFSFDYSKTLEAWKANFEAAWPNKLEKIYGPRFYRMWTLYLSLAQAAFATRSFQLWQIVFSRDGLKQGYQSVR